MRILLVSTPVSPIGAGDGGGVETLLRQLAAALLEREHAITVIAPAGSCLPDAIPLHPVPGNPPPNAAAGARYAPTMVQSDGVLERMWDEARRLAPRHDGIIAFSYDWLSYYLTSFLPIPVLHLVTLPSCIQAVDREISEQYSQAPDRFAFCSRAQASTFSFIDVQRTRIIPGAVDTDQFQFRAEAEPLLVWAARISPEKGLEDAVRVAQWAALPLHVCGKIQDQAYWRRIVHSVAPETIVYHGLLPHHLLGQLFGRAMALLATPKWVEAFGLTVIEALACGTPVITYDRGGPAEIVEHARSGFLVPPDDVTAMVDAVRRVPTLERSAARRRAEEYSTARLAERTEEWFATVLHSPRQPKSRGAGAG